MKPRTANCAVSEVEFFFPLSLILFHGGERKKGNLPINLRGIIKLKLSVFISMEQ
jgi:hypothetical protein